MKPYDQGTCYPDRIISGGEFDLVMEMLFTCAATEAGKGTFQARYIWSAPPVQLIPGQAFAFDITGDWQAGTPDFGNASLWAYFKDHSLNKGGGHVTGLVKGQRHFRYVNAEEQKITAPWSSDADGKITLVVFLKGSSHWFWEYDYLWAPSGNTSIPTIIQTTWVTQATDYRGKIGQLFTLNFPPGGTVSSRLWGTDIYTDDSSIGSAAVHAGLITAEKGGSVTIEIRPGQSAYTGTTRNGVTSASWGPYEGSFTFVKKGQPVEIKRNQNTVSGTWATLANQYRGQIGSRYTFTFPAGGSISTRVWGTDVYTDDSSIATAAVHAGLISAEKGGSVTIEIRSGQSAYTGTTRNGVTSSSWGPYEGSFIFVR